MQESPKKDELSSVHLRKNLFPQQHPLSRIASATKQNIGNSQEYMQLPASSIVYPHMLSTKPKVKTRSIDLIYRANVTALLAIICWFGRNPSAVWQQRGSSPAGHAL